MEPHHLAKVCKITLIKNSTLFQSTSMPTNGININIIKCSKFSPGRILSLIIKVLENM